MKDYITAQLSYDEDSAVKVFEDVQEERMISSRNFINTFDEDDQTNAICGGYSVSFQLLCDLIDNPEYTCYKINGSMSSAGETIQHT